MKISFIRNQKPRRFVYKPIYWDPEKEEREEREARINKELGIKKEGEGFVSSITKGSFRKGRKDDLPFESDNMKREKKMANIRLLIIIITLLLIAAFLYSTSGDYLRL